MAAGIIYLGAVDALPWPSEPPANSDRDPYDAMSFDSLCRAAFGDTRPESRPWDDMDPESRPWDDMDPDDRWDAKHARSEERARYREEMGDA